MARNRFDHCKQSIPKCNIFHIALDDLSTEVLALAKALSTTMTPGEIAMARTIFRGAVDYHKVKVHHGGWWVFAGMQNTAVTPNGEMYYPASTEYYREDFANTGNDRDKALFMHEMTHVWQYQLGYPVKRKGLTVTSRGESAYRYILSERLGFSDYNMEQQGEIISDYYLICVLGNPRGVWNRLNMHKSPDALAKTLETFLADPADKTHLPS